MCLLGDQLLAQKFNAVLPVIVELAGGLVFAKFGQDELYHILKHPRSIEIAGPHWGLVTGVEWGCGGDGWGWVMGGDVCWKDCQGRTLRVIGNGWKDSQRYCGSI